MRGLLIELPLMKGKHLPIRIIVVSGCQEKSLFRIASESTILDWAREGKFQDIVKSLSSWRFKYSCRWNLPSAEFYERLQTLLESFLSAIWRITYGNIRNRSDGRDPYNDLTPSFYNTTQKFVLPFPWKFQKNYPSSADSRSSLLSSSQYSVWVHSNGSKSYRSVFS